MDTATTIEGVRDTALTKAVLMVIIMVFYMAYGCYNNTNNNKPQEGR